jgi:hypothetical protein
MAAKRSRARRWLWLLLLPALALGAFLWLRAQLQPERLTDFLLQQAQQATGLEFALDQPADVGLGTLRAADWSVRDLQLQLDRLRDAQPSALALSGVFVTAQVERPLDLGVQTTPTDAGGELTLDPLRLAWRDADAVEVGALEGRLVLAPPRLALHGSITMVRWPAAWPPLPLGGEDAADAAINATLDFAGTTDLQGRLALALERAGARIESESELGDVIAWLGRDRLLALPPLRGEARAETLEFGGIRLDGVRVELRDAAVEDDDAGD